MARISIFLVIALLLTHFILVVCCIEANAPTCDEIAHHVASGYSYLITRDFRMNPSNPPLVRELSALPLLFLNLKLPLDSQAWIDGNSPVFGRQFFYELNTNAGAIIYWARIPIAMLSLALGLLIFLWSSSLYGYSGGLLSLALYSFSPNIIAHAGLATVDLGAALFICLSLFAFRLFLKIPSLKNIILAGVCFGLAQASKYTSILLVPIFIMLSIIFYGIQKNNTARPVPGRLISGILSIFLIGAVTLFASYFFELKPLIKNAPDVSGKIEYIKGISQKMHFEKMGIDKERAVWIAQNVAVPFSAYLVGLSGVVHQGSIGGYNTFLLGKVCRTGFWDYFLVAFFVKSTLPALLLFLCAVILLFTYGKKVAQEGLFLIIPIVFFFLVTAYSKTQVGIRHLLEIYPLIFIFAGSMSTASLKKILKYSIFGAAVIWQFASLMTAFPYPIAYFNEIAGGPDNGYNILRDSNLDWGQGLKALKSYMAHNGIYTIKLNYFGTADPSYYNIDYEPMSEQDFKIPGRGVYAISAQNLYGIEWANRIKPAAKIAHSIFIYKF